MFYNKIFRFINQNRRIIILLVSIGIFIILLIKALNNLSFKSDNDETDNEIENTSREIQDTRTSVITNTSVGQKTSTQNYNLLEEFVNLCNDGNIEEAYQLLSDECKQNVYPNLEGFANNYVNVVFKSRKSIDVKNWIKSGDYITYLVTYSDEDVLSTGDVNNNKFQDYITVNSSKQQLNINKYIKKEELNKTQEIKNIKFTINYVDIFKDYEVYNIKIENKNNNDIILDNLSSVSSTYIETSSETQINCSNYEAGINSFKYGPGMAKTIELKVIKQYNENLQDEKLIFSSAILDTGNIDNTCSIEVEL